MGSSIFVKCAIIRSVGPCLVVAAHGCAVRDLRGSCVSGLAKDRTHLGVEICSWLDVLSIDSLAVLFAVAGLIPCTPPNGGFFAIIILGFLVSIIVWACLALVTIVGVGGGIGFGPIVVGGSLLGIVL
jgi:hypothetical protein